MHKHSLHDHGSSDAPGNSSPAGAHRRACIALAARPSKTASFSEAIALFDQQGFRLGSASSHVFLGFAPCHLLGVRYRSNVRERSRPPDRQHDWSLPDSALLLLSGGARSAALPKHPASTEGQARLATLDLCCCKMEAWAAHSAGNFLHRLPSCCAPSSIACAGKSSRLWACTNKSLQSIRRTHSQGFAWLCV